MNVVAGIFVAMYGMGCYAAGICMAMAFKNEKSYDKGYDDGWADAKRDERFGEPEEGKRWEYMLRA